MTVFNKKSELFKRSFKVAPLKAEDRPDAVAAAENVFEFYNGILGAKPGYSYSVAGFFEEFARNRAAERDRKAALPAAEGVVMDGSRPYPRLDANALTKLPPEERIAAWNWQNRPKGIDK